jgi:predicted dehydrogenase
MSKIRWGVLGGARIATSRFIPAMKEVRFAELSAIGSRSLDKSRSIGREFGIPRCFGSYEELLIDPAIDAIYVPLPNHLHVEWSIRAMEAGKHVLCEKPLCLAVAEVEALRAVRNRTGRHIEEAFSYRNHPQWAKMDSLLSSGAIGAVRAVQCTLAKQFLDPSDIRNNPARGGGALYDLGSYAISACTLVFGRPPNRVVAAIDRDPQFGIDRLSTAILDYGTGHATLTVGTQSGPSTLTHQQFSILGAIGWLRCDFPYAHGKASECHVYVGDQTSHGTFETAAFPFDAVNQYALQIDRFSRHLLGEEVPVWPIEDARITLTVIEALFASANTGTWVSLDAH